MRSWAQSVMSFPGVLLLVALQSPFEDCSCGDSECGTTPLQGARSDFTTTPGLHDGIYVGTPRPCTAYSGGTAYGIQLRVGGGTTHLSEDGSIPDSGCPTGDAGAGSCSYASWSSLGSAVVQRMYSSGIYQVSARSGRHCDTTGDPGPFYFVISDWADANTAVTLIGQELKSLGIADTVDLLLADAPNECWY